jgi:polysaccharide biosynthesis transport protein
LNEAAEPKEAELRTYARILWRRKWIFLAVVIVIPVAVYLASARAAKVYQSSTLIEVQPTAVDTTEGAAQGGPSAQFIAIAAKLIQTTGVAEAAARHLPGPPSSPGALLRATSVSTDPNTGFITITAIADSPARAAAIANAFGAAINVARAREAVTQLNLQIAGIAAQLNALPSRAVTLRNQALAQEERLKAERQAQGSNAQIIQPATASAGPISPRPKRDAALALIVALFLGLGVVAAVETLDRRIRRPEELERLGGLPVLSSLPRSAFDGNIDAPRVAEGLRGLRANLGFFNVDRDVRSIVITSGRAGEGKSLVSVGLARAYAAAGSDVILVDADLRRPTIASRLGMPPGPGLGGVLVGKISVSQALMQQTANGRPMGLRVLAAGELPPNPAELLGSERMKGLLQELASMCDLLIIDTSPLLMVSDALGLLDQVSGTLLVARLGLTRRDDLERMRKILAATKSASLGIVATGAGERTNHPQGYAQYLTQPQAAEVAANGSADKPSRPLAGRRRR